MDTTGTASQSSTYIPIPYLNGWTCQNCGTFVESGIVHSCTYRWSEPRWVNPPAPRLSDEDVDRIARRVVEMLKEAEA